MWFSRLIGLTVIDNRSNIEPRIGKQSPRKGNHSGAVIDHQGVSGMPLIQDKWTLQGIILYYGLKTISMYLAFYELSETGCLPQLVADLWLAAGLMTMMSKIRELGIPTEE